MQRILRVTMECFDIMCYVCICHLTFHTIFILIARTENANYQTEESIHTNDTKVKRSEGGEGSIKLHRLNI